MVEFRSPYWEAAQTFLSLMADHGARLVSLNVSSIASDYRVRSTLEGLRNVELKRLMDNTALFQCLSIETLFSSER